MTETTKANAQHCYEGYKAYQPIAVSWAETMLVLADEFHEGNVPASRDIIRLVDEAYEVLTPGPWRVKIRSDSAGYRQACLEHWDSRGWEFAVSADMSQQFRQEIKALPVGSWQVWQRCREVTYLIHSLGVNLCLGEDFPPLNSRPRCH